MQKCSLKHTSSCLLICHLAISVSSHIMTCDSMLHSLHTWDNRHHKAQDRHQMRWLVCDVMSIVQKSPNLYIWLMPLAIVLMSSSNLGRLSSTPRVQALLDAGADLTGKTHLDELAYSLNGENIHYGTPVNPACPERIPGGSSSGSAVSLLPGVAHHIMSHKTVSLRHRVVSFLCLSCLPLPAKHLCRVTHTKSCSQVQLVQVLRLWLAAVQWTEVAQLMHRH